MEMSPQGCHKTILGDDNDQVCAVTFEAQDADTLKTHKENALESATSWRLPRLLISNNKAMALKYLVHIAVIVYTLAAVNHWNSNGRNDIGWKNGLGLLIILVTVYFGVLLLKLILRPFKFMLTTNTTSSTLKTGALVLFFTVFALYIGVETKNDRSRLLPLVGLFAFVLVGYALSKHRRHVNWNTVATGLATQITIGLLTIRWPIGRSVIRTIGELAEKFFSFAYIGAQVTYGHELIDVYAVFAFKVLSVLFFMCFIIEILFYYGILQTIIIKLGWCLQTLLGTTTAESVNACASVFLGMSEAPIIIKPYLINLTESEIHAVMMGGFSTVAGTVFAAYTSFGIDSAYIITASIMSAPTALSFSKLIFPETEKSMTNVEQLMTVEKTQNECNVMDAACKGAQFGLQLVGAIIANIVAFVSFVAFVDAIISWLGRLVGFDQLSFQYILGKMLIPITLMLGIDFSECETVGRLIGLKMTVNEFVAYKQMGELIKKGKLNRRSEIVATFALCSFANPGSIGSMIATLTTLCPSQQQAITKNVFRAFIGGTVTCFLTATIASLLMPEDAFKN